MITAKKYVTCDMNGIDYDILGQKIIIWHLLDFDAANVLKDTLDKSFKPTAE